MIHSLIKCFICKQIKPVIKVKHLKNVYHCESCFISNERKLKLNKIKP